MSKIDTINQKHLKKGKLDIRTGDQVRIHQLIKEKGKERTQVFEGVVIAKKHGKGVSSTITVRRVLSGIGIEVILPVHSPNIKKIEVLKRSKTRKSKLYYLREAKGRRARLKKKDLAEAIILEEPEEEKSEPEEKKTEEKDNQDEEPKKEEDLKAKE